MPSDLFTVTQTADYLKVCDKTVRRLIHDNKLTASKVGNRSWRIKKADIDAYLEQHTNAMKGVATDE